VIAGLVGSRAGRMSSGLDHKRDWTRLAKSRPKTGQNCSREGNRGPLKSSFSAFIHFPKKRTLTGWALLFAMGKHTSKEFLYGRKHSRISKCPKTRSKTGPKTDLKRGPDQHPKSRKRPYTGKSSLQRASKKGSKLTPKMTPKMMDKSTSKIASGAKVPTSHFSKAGIGQTAIRVPNLQNTQNRGQFPKNPMKQAISGAMADRKRTMKMTVKNRGKNAA
jgi:hypothetical protein